MKEQLYLEGTAPADRTPKAKTMAAPVEKKRKTKHTNVDTTGAEAELASLNAKTDKRAAKAEAEANRVESRRVPRATVAAEVDPFADLRDRMKETEH